MVSFCKRIAESSRFQNFITGVIVFAGVLVGLETYSDFVDQYNTLLDVLNLIVLGIFTVEILIKVIAEGRRPWHYFYDPWNIFDFLIVVAAYLPIGAGYITVLRLLRLLRVLRLLHAVPQLQVLVSALLKSIPSMAYVSLFLFLLFYVYGVAGTFLFAKNDPIHFGTLGLSLLTLFQVVTLEGWTDILYIQMYGCDQFGYEDKLELCLQSSASPTAGIVYFVTFILIGTMIILNLFIGVIMNSMTEAQEEADARRSTQNNNATSLPHELKELQKQLSEMQKRIGRLHMIATVSSSWSEKEVPGGEEPSQAKSGSGMAS